MSRETSGSRNPSPNGVRGLGRGVLAVTIATGPILLAELLVIASPNDIREGAITLYLLQMFSFAIGGYLAARRQSSWRLGIAIISVVIGYAVFSFLFLAGQVALGLGLLPDGLSLALLGAPFTITFGIIGGLFGSIRLSDRSGRPKERR
jgi:hypothetical protein